MEISQLILKKKTPVDILKKRKNYLLNHNWSRSHKNNGASKWAAVKLEKNASNHSSQQLRGSDAPCRPKTTPEISLSGNWIEI
jgi:hypothetical protein